MEFLKKIDHIKLLKIALGISIFSIGYLLTMFYFQMNELENNKIEIEKYSKADIELLHFKSIIEEDSYRTQSQILNQSISSNTTDFNMITNAAFIKNAASFEGIEPKYAQKQNFIKELIVDYIAFKKELFAGKSNSTVSNYNTINANLLLNINELSADLESKINTSNDAYLQMLENSKTSGFLIALISLTIFVLAYVKMNEDLMKLQKINDDVSFINQTLQNAEMVAGFGSWKLNTVENRFIISDNFYRLLGTEPNSFTPSLDKIMSFVHPEDRSRVLQLHEDSFNKNETTTIIYRYLLEDGTVRHMISVGKFLNNSKGELVKIGVNQDITELMKKTKELEDKNQRLISTNSELESFNNIVSHDLQEPLRKIQMFISRIESKDFVASSNEATITYFDKIKSAASRMQNLMNDLVDFTRTVKGDRIFEQVDLNVLFEEITEDLILIIEEKQAIILIDQLPTILGTKFQIQQLFVNLMSNALKYVKPGIVPKINVKLEEFSQDFVNDKNISSEEYYKITVTDNGIGFEQKHADKIFMLFKRLQTDQSYKGTGLGLAICKKIVDNNNGFIKAVGVPDQGSVFTVYLPKNTNLS